MSKTQTISDQLIDLVDSAPESLREICRQTGLSSGNLSQARRGNRDLGGKEINALADYFGVRLTKPRKRAAS